MYSNEALRTRLAGLVPPLLRDAKEAPTHAGHEVGAIVQPAEVELPIEHHLHLKQGA